MNKMNKKGQLGDIPPEGWVMIGISALVIILFAVAIQMEWIPSLF
jgi:hypothetical protein